MIVNNTRFIHDLSLNDAVGAFYLINADLNVFNLTILDCSSTFGAGITALKSNLNLTNSTLKDNAAKYEGGAIYQVYGSILLNASDFINNTARNGGALFIDDVNIYNITYNEFKNNTALIYACAVYTLSVNGTGISNNTFENNIAYQFNDIYNATNVNLTIGNGNYLLIAINEIFNSTIPSKYDLRDHGYKLRVWKLVNIILPPNIQILRIRTLLLLKNSVK